jgi:hypothetical protein
MKFIRDDKTFALSEPEREDVWGYIRKARGGVRKHGYAFARPEADEPRCGQAKIQQNFMCDPSKLAWERAGDQTKIFDGKFLVEVEFLPILHQIYLRRQVHQKIHYIKKPLQSLEVAVNV